MASICFPNLNLDCNLNTTYETYLYIYYLNLNKCKEAIEYLKQNPTYIRWDLLSLNPFAIELLITNPTQICWVLLCKNPAAIDIILQNSDKIEWDSLSANPHPKAIELLSKNKDKINYFELTTNSGAITLIIEELETTFFVDCLNGKDILKKKVKNKTISRGINLYLLLLVNT